MNKPHQSRILMKVKQPEVKLINKLLAINHF